MDGSNTSVFFWDGLFFQGPTVSFREGGIKKWSSTWVDVGEVAHVDGSDNGWK